MLLISTRFFHTVFKITSVVPFIYNMLWNVVNLPQRRIAKLLMLLVVRCGMLRRVVAERVGSLAKKRFSY